MRLSRGSMLHLSFFILHNLTLTAYTTLTAETPFIQPDDSKIQLMLMIHMMVFPMISEYKDEDNHMTLRDMYDLARQDMDKDEKIKIFKAKTAEYVSAIKKLIQAITETNDKAADIINYMEEEIELLKEKHAEIVATISDSSRTLMQAYQGSRGDTDEKITIFMQKVAEYAAAIKRHIKAINANNDKAADITKYMEDEIEPINENHEEIVAIIDDTMIAYTVLQETLRTNWHCGSHF